MNLLKKLAWKVRKKWFVGNCDMFSNFISVEKEHFKVAGTFSEACRKANNWGLKSRRSMVLQDSQIKHIRITDPQHAQSILGGPTFGHFGRSHMLQTHGHPVQVKCWQKFAVYECWSWAPWILSIQKGSEGIFWESGPFGKQPISLLFEGLDPSPYDHPMGFYISLT